MAFTFSLHGESLKRKFSVYVVVAKSASDTLLYVGKTGDNNEGCNPIISRCGNHFSYNKMHSQVRNKINDHENRQYTYIFDHFDNYIEDEGARRILIDKINEMERWLNQEIQALVKGREATSLLNPLAASGYVRAAERAARAAFRTGTDAAKIADIVALVAAQVS